MVSLLSCHVGSSSLDRWSVLVKLGCDSRGHDIEASTICNRFFDFGILESVLSICRTCCIAETKLSDSVASLFDDYAGASCQPIRTLRNEVGEALDYKRG